ncbi:MAG: N-acetyltransferase [Clostridia bacterium]|nr:N-acetyltransferase [Clostridia bacterium]NLS84315.1 N-acetyltransferase [Oscillospiraceae bacterium]
MEFLHEDERIFAVDENGGLLAEVTFPVTDGVANINHTFVDPSLRGQGIAGQLMKLAAEQIKTNGLRALPTCSYAIKWFAEHK